jgi:plastocyanin
MDIEEPTGPGRMFLLTLGGAGILIAVLIAAMLVVPLQPKLSLTAPAAAAGVASIVMPPNASVLNFSPANITVFLGVNSTIEWTNQDATGHTVVSTSVPQGESQFQSKILSMGDTFKVTLNATGVYDYYCSIHPTTMRGSITVRSLTTVSIPSGTADGQLNYSPPSIVVVIGVNNTVAFVNRDGVPHTVTASDGSFDSGTMLAGQTWVHTFATPGSFSYVCTFHGWMRGTVTVRAGA